MELGGPNTLIWPRRDTSEVVPLTHAHPGGIAMLLAGRAVRISDLVRESDARLRAQRAATRLRERACEIAEEHGLTTSFLAMGTATWHTHDPERSPAAPVLLRRVDLRPTDVDADLRLDFHADVEINPALLTVLGPRAGGADKVARLVDLGRGPGNGFNPDPVYAALRERCTEVPGFEVSPSLDLALYPYGKAESIADLEAMEQRIAGHRALRVLRGETPSQGIVGGRQPDEGVDRSVLDLPAEQQAVLDRICGGEDLYVESPPGIDAARLVAAVIAGAAADGRRVLLLAEKSAALHAAARYLERVGLSDLVLHVDDPAGAVDPTQITGRWQVPAQGDETDAVQTRRRAARAAEILDRHAHATNLPREPWGVSVAEARDAVVALAAADPPPHCRVRLAQDVLRRTDLDAIERSAPHAARLAHEFAWDRRGSVSPWWRARLTPAKGVSWAEETIDGLLERDLAALDATMIEVFRDITEPVAQAPADHGRFLSAVERVRDTLDIFRPELFDAPVEPLIDATSPTTDLGVIERRRLSRQARKLLRPGRPPADLHAALVEAREQRASWARIVGGGGRPRIPVAINDAHDAYERVHDALASLDEVLPSQQRPLAELPYDELRDRLRELRRDRAGALACAETQDDLDALDETGLGDVVDDLARRRVPEAAVADELRYVWWMSVLQQVASDDTHYGSVTSADLDAALEEFVEADRGTVAANARDVHRAARATFREQGRGSRRVAHAVAAAAEGRRAAPRWRDGLHTWQDLLRASAPCWAMSPLAVGLVLPADERFDLVVVDDASRTTLARVAAAVARADQLVVVGDTTQQGPRGYSTDPAITAPPLDYAGLADPAETLLPVVRLRVSGDPRPWLPSAVDRGLVHTPAPDEDPTPRLRQLSNDAGSEVGVVAALVAERAVTGCESLGVVTFDEGRAAEIRAAVREIVRQRPDVARAIDGLDEPLLIKPVDRWQREQRDRVVVSVGPVSVEGAAGAPSTGSSRALAAAGGGRLVVTALTRGRRQVDWVTPVTVRDLRAAPRDSGTAALRQVLAELDDLERDPSRGDPSEEGADPQSGALQAGYLPWQVRSGADGGAGALVDGFVQRLQLAGLRAVAGVGHGVHRVDIAVGDPDRSGYQLAISLDGPESATRAGARQRDRILPQELTALGWRHLRLWAIDIFADPARQEAKVLRALQEACRPNDHADL
ncbi:hypothetical protein GCM10022199_10790 [Marihabitans asiaticum]|uniref:Uncharacterized protein DUF4011 n=2 Tax=Marihabitans asiaticum TaxID=415218 RepID=A0A560WHQ0_9MICO|nr:uncharacterized protein DUF4011 [Marihabitans asiaticum]